MEHPRQPVIARNHRLRTLWHKIQRLVYGIWLTTFGRPASKVCLTLIIVALSGAIGLYYAEKNQSDDYSTVGRTLCSVVVLLISGFDVAPPSTRFGWALAIFTMLLGIAFVAVVTADLASHLVRAAIRPWSQAKVQANNHFVIAGWGRNDCEMLNNLVSDSLPILRHVVVIDEKVEQPPIRDPYVHFIRGNPVESTVLELAGIRKAAVTIIPLDWRIQSDSLKDSINTLIMLAVEGCNPATYSCVEIVRRDSKRHLSRTAANEVICVGDLSIRLLTQSALNPGISLFLSILLSPESVTRLHKEPLPPSLAGMSFRQAFSVLNAQLEEILIAVERRAGSGKQKIIANPPQDISLEAGDHLFLLGRSTPEDIRRVAQKMG